jgi:hypothetical protein
MTLSNSIMTLSVISNYIYLMTELNDGSKAPIQSTAMTLHNYTEPTKFNITTQYNSNIQL